MTTPKWMHAPSGRCLLCNEELGADPHFIVDPPHGEHLRCIDWTKRPWPFARLERRLEARSRALRAASAAVTDLGGFLRRSRSLWPDRMVAEVVEAGVRTVGDRLDRAGWRAGGD
jgi:hypothetical protein